MPLFGLPNFKKPDARADYPGLVKALSHQQAGVRAGAAEALGHMGAPAVRPLVVSLGDSDAPVRTAASEALVRIGGPAVEPLIAALRSQDHVMLVRVAASEALVRIGAPAVEPLIAALTDEDRGLRMVAVGALVDIGGPAVGPLIVALEHDDPSVRAAVGEALVDIGRPAIEPLTAAVKRWDVREAAAAALDALGWSVRRDEAGAAYWVAKREWDECLLIGAPAVKPLVAALKRGDKEDRRCAAEALARIGTPSVEPLIAAVEDGGRNALLRASAGETLVRIGAPSVAPLAAALKRGDQGTRKFATEALVKIGTSAVQPLIAALKDDDSDVRRYAARALGRIRDAAAVEPLLGALEAGDAGLSRYANEALVEIGIPAVDALITALEFGDREVRRSAAAALGRIGDEGAVEALVAAFLAGDPSVRGSATEALVEIGGPSVGPLIGALGDEKVGKFAAVALGRLGDARAVEPLMAAFTDPAVRRYAGDALVAIGHPAVEALLVAFRGGDQDDRKATALALGRIGDPRAVETFVIALGDRGTRKYASDALVAIGGPAVKPLIGGLKDRGVRKHASEALVWIGGPAVKPLTEALKGGDKDLRECIARVLGQIGDPRARKVLRAARSDPDQTVRKVAREGLAGQALVDKLLSVRIGMTESELTGVLGRPKVTRVGAGAMDKSNPGGQDGSEEAPGQARWVFETDSGNFLVVMRDGHVAELFIEGLLDRLRPAWRVQSAQ